MKNYLNILKNDVIKEVRKIKTNFGEDFLFVINNKNFDEKTINLAIDMKISYLIQDENFKTIIENLAKYYREKFKQINHLNDKETIMCARSLVKMKYIIE